MNLIVYGCSDHAFELAVSQRSLDCVVATSVYNQLHMLEVAVAVHADWRLLSRMYTSVEHNFLSALLQ